MNLFGESLVFPANKGGGTFDPETGMLSFRSANMVAKLDFVKGEAESEFAAMRDAAAPTAKVNMRQN